MVVTGAGGRTGALVMKKLLERPSEFSARGVVRSDKSAAQLRGWGASDEQIVTGDLLESGEEVLGKAMAGADALVRAGGAPTRRLRVVLKRPPVLSMTTHRQPHSLAYCSHPALVIPSRPQSIADCACPPRPIAPASLA